MLRPIGYPDGVVNSGGVRTFGKCYLVLLNGIGVSFLIRVKLAHKRVQLERIGVLGLQFLDSLQGSILVNSRKLVKSIQVFGVLLRFDEAIAQLDREVEEHPKDLDALYQLARIHKNASLQAIEHLKAQDADS